MSADLPWMVTKSNAGTESGQSDDAQYEDDQTHARSLHGRRRNDGTAAGEPKTTARSGHDDGWWIGGKWVERNGGILGRG
jgi:hypothetical protein